MDLKLNLELDKAVRKIKEFSPKTILIQLPDGLKPKAEEIKKELERSTSREINLRMASCYGAGEIPKVEGIDLLIQFGHSDWR